MSKENKLQLLSPLFLKYQADFEKNPRSRVFAPLAEAYRKIGMTDKAMEILAQGIRFHPTYVMGYLGLAFCYYDIKQYNLAYSTLRPLTESNRDNLRLLKLFADICQELGRKEEALETLKYLLFINPRDKAVAEIVRNLEIEVENQYKPQHKPIIISEAEFRDEESAEKSFPIERLRQDKLDSNDFDDWMAIDLTQDKKEIAPLQTSTLMPTSALNYDDWSVKKNTQIEKDKNSPFDTPDSTITLDFTEEKEETPLITHTLVDLYCGQGHIEKALEVLEKILLLNPGDEKTLNKIKEIKSLMQPLDQYEEPVTAETAQPLPIENYEIPEEHLIAEFSQNEELTDLEEISEEDGRRHLMSLIDEKIGPIEIEEDDHGPQKQVVQKVEEKLNLFLQKIQKRALENLGRV